MFEFDDRNKKRIVILSPHPDDGEIGCGGTLAKFKDNCLKVNFIATFSDATATVQEANRAGEVLGMEVMCGGYTHRNIWKDRQRLLDELVKLSRLVEPHVVFMPCLHDIHQDHVVMAAEGLRAFKGSTILGYDMPWNNIGTINQTFFNINEEELKMKADAVGEYASQGHRLYMKRDFVISLAKIRGAQCGFPYAESFELIRLIVK